MGAYFEFSLGVRYAPAVLPSSAAFRFHLIVNSHLATLWQLIRYRNWQVQSAADNFSKAVRLLGFHFFFDVFSLCHNPRLWFLYLLSVLYRGN